MWLNALVFLSDLAIAYISTKMFYAREKYLRWQVVGWGILLDIVVNMNLVAIAEIKWHIIPFSVAGGALGTFTSMDLRKKKQ